VNSHRIVQTCKRYLRGEQQKDVPLSEFIYQLTVVYDIDGSTAVRLLTQAENEEIQADLEEVG